jgi:hypothetical protein
MAHFGLPQLSSREFRIVPELFHQSQDIKRHLTNWVDEYFGEEAPCLMKRIPVFHVGELDLDSITILY